jgi:vacuolar-type H+-ATPase subunit C/Vma6
MIRTSRYAFLLAKIYGILSKSFIGENYRDVLRLRKLGEIYDLLFPGERKEATKQQLTVELEDRIVRSRIESLTYVLSLLGDPPEILVHILRKYEYQSVKSVVRSIAHEMPSEAVVRDIGAYATVSLADAAARENAIASSRYAWVLNRLKTVSLVAVENEIDRDYYATLLAHARKLPMKDRRGVLRLVSLEITLANVVWALRLRFLFGMDAEQAQPLLIPGLLDARRKAVAQAFEIPADSMDRWRTWAFGWMLEDQLGESFQAPDPVRAEQQAARRLYTRAHQIFHQDPFTLTPIVAFFTLKEYEAGLLQTAVEALRLSVSEQDVLALVGAR